MKQSPLKCAFGLLSDPKCESLQMPGVTAVTLSDTDLTNFPKRSKMHAPPSSLLRLNSVGEASSENFPEAVGHRNVRFSKSLDSGLSPGKNFLSGVSLDYNNMQPRTAMAMGPATNHYHSRAQDFSSQQAKSWWSSFSSQWGCQPQIGYYDNMFRRHPSFQTHMGHNNNMPFMKCSSPSRFPGGFFPYGMFTAVSSLPNGSNKIPQARCKVPQAPCSKPTSASPRWRQSNLQNANCSAKAVDHSRIQSNLKSKTATVSHSQKPPMGNDLQFENNDKEVCSNNSIESCVDKLTLTDPVDKDPVLDLGGNASVPAQNCHSDNPDIVNNVCNNRDNNLKRGNEKMGQTNNSSDSMMKTGFASIEISSVLFQRKTPKKGRPSCKKRKKRQHRKASFSLQSGSCQNVDEPTVSSGTSPSKSSSQLPFSSSSPCHEESSIKSLIISSPSKSRPNCVARLFCSPDSDSELSDNDLDDCDSVAMASDTDFPKCLSPINNLGSSLSIDSLFKPKKFSCLDSLMNDSVVKNDPEQEPNSESPASSPGSKASIVFSVSLSINEDDDSECSFDSFSTSPSEQLVLDFGFGNGLSLEAIIGRKAETISSPPAEQSPATETLSLEQKELLIKINTKWNEHYPTLPMCSSSSTDRGKVQFASEDALTQTHIVGNEERRGTWVEDGQRFQKRIGDVEKVVSHVLSENHRHKIRETLKLS